MSRFLLVFFGGASILFGALSLIFGFLAGLNATLISWGIGLLISGATMLGFVRALDLLEQIAENTRRPSPAAASADRHRQGIEPAMAEFSDGLGALLRKDRPAPPR